MQNCNIYLWQNEMVLVVSRLPNQMKFASRDRALQKNYSRFGKRFNLKFTF